MPKSNEERKKECPSPFLPPIRRAAGRGTGTMAKEGAKKRAKQNATKITLLFRALACAVVTHVGVRFVLRRATTPWWNYALFLLVTGASVFCYTSLASIASPTFDAKSGELIDGGADISGGMSEYYQDIVYVSIFVLVTTAVVSQYFWLLTLVFPAYATYLLWTYVIQPYVFMPRMGELPEAEESKEDKRRRERSERRGRKRF